MADYVIKSWKIDEKPLAEGQPSVQIEGRASGFLSWLLNQIKISPTVSLTVTSDKITFEKGSLEGRVIYHTPLSKVCSTFFGYTKPWKQALILGLAIGVATIFLLGIPGIIVGCIYYFLKKELTLGYTDVGGGTHAITFERSLIEGKHIDETAAERVCMIIQNLVDAEQQRVKEEYS